MKFNKLLINSIITLTIFLIDRVSKIYIIKIAELENVVDIYLTPFLNFYLIWNKGIAFGLFSFNEKFIYNIITALIIIVSIIVLIMVVKSDGFKRVFLGENCWHAIRISGGMINRIKYIAAYQTSPVSAVTHYAHVARIESYGNEGKYKLIFSGPAIILDKQIPHGDSTAQLQRSRYTNFDKLFTSKSILDLF